MIRSLSFYPNYSMETSHPDVDIHMNRESNEHKHIRDCGLFSNMLQMNW